ncbi:MAG: UDP-2,3-diacylglucosamine diphosphatase LpxI [Desulfobacterales bacterium]|nr:UDP-2,3-diacylglucosamine diphosphatase LpxI [Desulfobacterales bacterium]
MDTPHVDAISAPPIGLLAAGGHLPVATAMGIRAAGRRVACVGIKGHFDQTLPDLCDEFRTAGIIQLGRWIRVLRKFGCREMVMVGKIQKAQMYEPFRWFRYIPDWRGGKVWFISTRHDKRADSMLTAVADEFSRDGITMIDSTRYIPDLLADAGVMTKTQPSAAQQMDIDFALPIVQRMGDLDVGQAVAVSDRDIIAVEAIEGTDEMIARAGSLCKRGKWALVKLAKPNQDMRFDVPTVGPRTIENLKNAGAGCLAVEAGKTILIDKPDFLAEADKAGIAVVGVSVATG